MAAVVQSELEGLSAPLSDGGFGGRDIERSPDLFELQSMRIFGRDRNWEANAEDPVDREPDWAKVESKAIALLERSRDLRVLAHAAAATIRTQSWDRFLELITLPAQWLSGHWEEIYPKLDEDAVARQQALNLLSDRWAIVIPLRRKSLANGRPNARFSLRDVDVAQGAEAPDAGVVSPSLDDIQAAVRARKLGELQTLLARLGAAIAALQSVSTLMSERAEVAPNFDLLGKLLGRLVEFLKPLVPSVAGMTGDGSVAGLVEVNVASVAAAGVVRSRDDAAQILDVVAEYFRRTEPSSPVPLLLERARRMINQPFLEILADLVPDSVDDAKRAAGVREKKT
jgi:type VI secretion system protein ImpA